MIPINLPDAKIVLELTMPAIIAETLDPSFTGFAVVAFSTCGPSLAPLMVVSTAAVHPLALSRMLEAAALLGYTHPNGDASQGTQAKATLDATQKGGE